LIDQDVIRGSWNHNIYYKNKKTLKAEEIIKAQSMNWHFANNRWDFDFIKKGTLIWTENWNKIIAPYNLYILFPKLPQHINDEVCVYATESY
jgi:hypothetical protein